MMDDLVCLMIMGCFLGRGGGEGGGGYHQELRKGSQIDSRGHRSCGERGERMGSQRISAGDGRGGCAEQGGTQAGHSARNTTARLPPYGTCVRALCLTASDSHMYYQVPWMTPVERPWQSRKGGTSPHQLRAHSPASQWRTPLWLTPNGEMAAD